MVLAMCWCLARREEVATAPVHHRNVSDSRQRVQGSAGIRWASSFHHRKGRRGGTAAQVAHLLQPCVHPFNVFLDAPTDPFAFFFATGIDLPPYKSFEALEHKLTIAVEETLGFGQE